MSRLRKRVLALLRNYYFLFGLIFLVWMFFLDSVDLPLQFRLRKSLERMREKERFYQTQIEQIEKDYEKIRKDSVTVEKVSRERYLMRKEGEDVYLVK